MQQCPECNEVFDDSAKFCDIDGTPLIDEAALLRAALQNSVISREPTRDEKALSRNVAWFTIPIGILIGVVLSLFVYLMELSPKGVEASRQVKSNPVSERPSERRTQESSILTPQPTPIASIDDTETDDKTNDAAAAPTTAPAESSATAESATLNNGPISTGDKTNAEQRQAIIKLKDGVSVEADAVWEDKQGIWYRRGGLVSLIGRDRVAEISAATQSTLPQKKDALR